MDGWMVGWTRFILDWNLPVYYRIKSDQMILHVRTYVRTHACLPRLNKRTDGRTREAPLLQYPIYEDTGCSIWTLRRKEEGVSSVKDM